MNDLVKYIVDSILLEDDDHKCHCGGTCCTTKPIDEIKVNTPGKIPLQRLSRHADYLFFSIDGLRIILSNYTIGKLEYVGRVRQTKYILINFLKSKNIPYDYYYDDNIDNDIIIMDADKFSIPPLNEIKVNKPGLSLPLKINNINDWYVAVEFLNRIGYKWVDGTSFQKDDWDNFNVRYPYYINKIGKNVASWHYKIVKLPEDELNEIKVNKPTIDEKTKERLLNDINWLKTNAPVKWANDPLTLLRRLGDYDDISDMILLSVISSKNLKEIKVHNPNPPEKKFQKIWNDFKHTMHQLNPLLRKAYQDEDFSEELVQTIIDKIEHLNKTNNINFEKEYFVEWINDIKTEDLPRSSSGSFYTALNDTEWLYELGIEMGVRTETVNEIMGNGYLNEIKVHKPGGSFPILISNQNDFDKWADILNRMGYLWNSNGRKKISDYNPEAYLQHEENTNDFVPFYLIRDIIRKNRIMWVGLNDEGDENLLRVQPL